MRYEIRSLGLLFATAMAVAGTLYAQQPASAPADNLDQAFQKAMAYQIGQSRECLTVIEDAVRAAMADPAQRQALAQRLATMLGSAATLDAKQFVCRQLAVIGKDEQVPALTALLSSPDTHDMARFALERIPGAAADAALVDALAKTQGKAQVGVINSLGVRRQAGAVQGLAPLVRSADPEVAVAAVAALGKIGTAEAAGVLESSYFDVPEALKQPIGNAYIMCAEAILKGGDAATAAAMYQKAYDVQPPEPVLIAALRGLIAAQGEAGVPLLVVSLSAEDSGVAAAAADLVRTVPAGAIGAVVEALPTLKPSVQVVVLSGLAARGDKAALPAALALTTSTDEDVRIAAIRAVGGLGDGAAAAQLAQAATAAEGAELKAIQDSIAIMRGADVNAALIGLATQGEAKVRVVAIGSLEARHATDALTTLVATARDADASVRAASLKSLASLGSDKEIPALIAILSAEIPAEERELAKGAIVAISKRAEKPSAAIVEALPQVNNAAVRDSLMRALAEIGDNAALEAIRAALKDPNREVHSAALNALAQWPNSALLPEAMEVARTGAVPPDKALGLRTALRMLGASSERPAAERVNLYKEILGLAATAEEKRLAIAGLAEVVDPAALELVRTWRGDPDVQTAAQDAAAHILRNLCKAEASVNNENAAKAIDGDANSRWDTGAAQKGGEWLLVDMGVEATVKKIVLDSTASPEDHPRAFEVYISKDKLGWGAPVAKGEGKSPVSEAAFAPTAGRYIKVVQTGAAERNYWSVNELKIETE